ncbi:MAG: ATP-binding protein [Opitutales bacterium]
MGFFRASGSWRRPLGWLLLAACVLGARAEDAPRRVKLTQEEQAWLDAHPVVRVGYDVREAPFCFADEKGRVVGIDADYLALISARTGLLFEGVTTETGWLDVFRKEFRNPPVDMMTNLGFLPERQNFLTYTLPYCFSAIVIITREDAPASISPENLKHRRVGIVSGFEAEEVALRRAEPDFDLVEFADDQTMMKAVATGQVYAAVDDVITAAYFVRRLGLTNLHMGSSLPFPDGTYLAVRKDQPLLTQILNKGIADISEVERNAIANRWVGVDVELGRKWARAFRVAAVLGGLIAVILILLSLHHRSLRRELVERRRIQGELEEARDHLARLSAEQTRILKMVAHDLRGPLTSIMLNADLLEMPPVPGETTPANFPAAIRASARSMHELIEELLSSHRIGADQPALVFTPVDLTVLARTALGELAAAARSKRIALKLAGPATIRAETDPGALGKVLNNLLSNAVKYSPPDTEVTLAVAADGERVRLSVSDQGPGVKTEERERIFAQHGRGSARPTAGESSHGLGLWIVRMLVTDLGGRVWCEEAPVSGACFVVELPVRAPGAGSAAPR